MQTNEGTFSGVGRLALYWRSWLPDGAPVGSVVLCHGLGEHSGRYEYVAERLTGAGYEVWALDHRGHGQSEGERCYVDRFSYYTDDLEKFRLGVVGDRGVPAFLIGHSMGGTIATSYTLLHPDAFRGLVLSGPAIAADETIPKPVVAIGRVLARFAPALGVQALDASEVSRDPAVVAAYRDDPLVYTGKVTARLGAEMLNRMAGFRSEVGAITQPVLVVHGTKDGLVPYAPVKVVFDAIGSTDKTHVELDGLYHEVFNEPERDDVLDTVISWLDARR